MAKNLIITIVKNLAELETKVNKPNKVLAAENRKRALSELNNAILLDSTP
ncbi:MAG: hypothetical protein HZB79_09090 [Deltaproteobacteria bacterium]|nr:hypothetical protein [Deltaproteobacteria bacterium]